VRRSGYSIDTASRPGTVEASLCHHFV